MKTKEIYKKSIICLFTAFSVPAVELDSILLGKNELFVQLLLMIHVTFEVLLVAAVFDVVARYYVCATHLIQSDKIGISVHFSLLVS